MIGLATRYGTREAGEPATVLLLFPADFESVPVGVGETGYSSLIQMIFTGLSAGSGNPEHQFCAGFHLVLSRAVEALIYKA
ncbi:hypothetical protein LMG18101_04692 [Ralstonia flaminis]|uniref:Uncharacterized protein n=1 Tax=Ralstonia flaminis TaxID=3058597 RepID=A0ABN9JUG0_9RALS|nr:hypothetical protein LMG18101_04692 [Ralstonia sp. LMG 18101]